MSRCFTFPDHLATRFDTLAHAHGGTAAALEFLLEGAAPASAEAPQGTSDEPAEAQEAKLDYTRAPPRLMDVPVQLSRAEVRALNRQCLKTGMTRSQWIAALVRHRLNGKPQLPPVDRKHISAVHRSVKAMESHLAKVARALARPDAALYGLEPRLDEIKQQSKALQSVGAMLHDILRASSAYWSANAAES